MLKNIYVLDASVVLSDGRRALYAFGTNDVVIPIAVIKELTRKRFDPILGDTAKAVITEISGLMSRGDISKGVSLGDGHGEFRIEMNHVDKTKLPKALKNQPTNEVRTLAVAMNLKAELDPNGYKVILVTKDLELKITALSVNVEVADLEDTDGRSADKYIKNLENILISDEEMRAFHASGHVQLDNDIPVNVGCILKTTSGASGLAISKGAWKFVKVTGDETVYNKVGRSAEQKILINQLKDESVGVVSVSGNAGSGKSFLMLAAALELVNDSRNEYNKIVIFRPINPVGGQHQDLGFLPGTMEEKLAPHTMAVYDTFGTMMSQVEVAALKRKNIVEFGSIAHVRGRTLANCIVILDELQNVESSTIITLLSRLGTNARVFVGWDVAQRDASFIGKYDGIFKVVRKLHGNKLFAHVTLKKSERSAISDMVAGLLDDL